MAMRRQESFLVAVSLPGPSTGFQNGQSFGCICIKYAHFPVCPGRAFLEIGVFTESVPLSPFGGAQHSTWASPFPSLPSLCDCDMPWPWILPATSRTIIGRSFQPMKIYFVLTCSIEWFIWHMCVYMFFEKIFQKAL